MYRRGHSSRVVTTRLATYVAVTALAATGFTGALPTEHSTASKYPCTKKPANYLGGYYYNTSKHKASYEGTSAFISAPAPSTCRTDHSSPNPSKKSIGTNFTTAWVMIADHDRSSWSQDGVIAGYNGKTYDWAEFSLGYHLGDSRVEVSQYDRFLHEPKSPVIFPNTKQAFHEKFVPNCSIYYKPYHFPCEVSLVGKNTLITATNFNPYNDEYWSEGDDETWTPEYSGEKTHPQSDILGVATNHTNFTGMGVQRFSDDKFERIPCVLSGIKPRANRSHHHGSTCHDVDIWTYPYS